jgi:hypothetical protein
LRKYLSVVVNTVCDELLTHVYGFADADFPNGSKPNYFPVMSTALVDGVTNRSKCMQLFGDMGIRNDLAFALADELKLQTMAVLEASALTADQIAALGSKPYFTEIKIPRPVACLSVELLYNNRTQTVSTPGNTLDANALFAQIFEVLTKTGKPYKSILMVTPGGHWYKVYKVGAANSSNIGGFKVLRA